ncbi:unnamed protein product, partial [Effrenium voratum]
MRYFQDPQSNTCATCIRNSTSPAAVPYGPGGCPENFVFEQREVCATPPSEGSFQQTDGVELARCSSLGAGWVTSRTIPQGCTANTSSGTVVLEATKYVCTACVPAPVVKQWEEFAGPFNRVCRGAGPTDNNPSYFEVRQKVPSVEACQALCLEELGEEGCKGIEFNRNSKRCELWKRKEGIWAFSYPQWEGFTCLRYGWPGKFLNPVNGGLDQACRGAGGQNSAGFYVVEAVRHMEDCRARCVAAPICKGLEFSKGRCEIWHSEVVTSEAKAGFECLRYEQTCMLPPREFLVQACDVWLRLRYLLTQKAHKDIQIPNEEGDDGVSEDEAPEDEESESTEHIMEFMDKLQKMDKSHLSEAQRKKMEEEKKKKRLQALKFKMRQSWLKRLHAVLRHSWDLLSPQTRASLLSYAATDCGTGFRQIVEEAMHDQRDLEMIEETGINGFLARHLSSLALGLAEGTRCVTWQAEHAYERLGRRP